MPKHRNLKGRLEHRIIEAVYKHPLIYNPSHPDFKNYKIREAEWAKIVEDFDDIGFTEEDMKKKWRNLRDCYHKHLRARFSSSSDTTRQGKLLYRYKYWPWAQQMAVFRPFFIQSAKKISSVRGTTSKILSLPETDPESSDDESDSKHERNQPASSQKKRENRPKFHPVKKIARKRVVRKTREETNQFANQKKNDNSLVENKIEQQNDDIDLLFLSYAKTVKKFSEQRQVMTKFKISQLLMQEELAQLKDNGNDCKISETTLDPILTAEVIPEVQKFEQNTDYEENFSE